MVSRRKFISSVSTAGAAVAAGGISGFSPPGSSFAAKAATVNISKNLPPIKNVILIIADTVRFDHLGCYGSSLASTRYIDEFAGEAVVFDKAYTSSYPTVPNRHDFLTGRYTYTYMGWAPMPKDEPTWAGTVGKAGMTSMMILDQPHIVENGFYYNRDFTGWEWIRGQESDNFHTAPHRIEPPCDPSKLRSPDRTVQVHGRNVHWRRYEEETFVARTVQRSIEWLQRNYTSGPFFLYVDTFDPHEPWDAPQWYVDMYNPGYTGQIVDYPRYWFADEFLTPSELKHTSALYKAELTLVDRWIGRLLQTIEDKGLFKNSMVIVTTDHGFLHGEHGIMGKAIIDGSNFAYCPLWEEIARVPLFIKLPDVPPFRTSAIVQPPDIMATALDFLHIQPPPGMHGSSYAGIFDGRKKKHRDFAVTSPTIASKPFISRLRTAINSHEWALHLTAKPITGKEGDMKDVDGLTKMSSSSFSRKIDEKIPYVGELYDIKNDPGQKNNLYEKKPGIVKELRSRNISFLKELGTDSEFIRAWE